MSSFKDIGLKPFLIQAIEDLGFQKPTDVQKECIPLLLEADLDLVALAGLRLGPTRLRLYSKISL